MRKYEHLARPIRVGSMTLKNRIMMTAMHHLYTENGLPTPRFNEYYWKRAEGGCALVVVGACRFDDYGAKASTMSLRDDSCVPAYKEFIEGMHRRGCKVAVQLYHAGRYMNKSDVIADDEAIGPSPVYTPYTKETCREMTSEDIDRVIREWAAGAARAKAAGFDAVEISASAGYLITQFLSPLTNRRTDEYGGSFENRCRFPLEVINAVREAMGPDYPILLRFGTHDLVPGSNGSEECLRIAKVLARHVDMLDLTGGWHESRTPQLTGETPRGAFTYLAKAIKEAVDIPVSIANRMGDPRTAEEAVALGYCDIVAMGRPLVADPELPNKLFSGKEHLIRRCVACNQGCLAGTFFDKPVRCLVNGLAGREYEISEAPAEKPKKILVVGGGPAGCETAIRAARRGHHVTIWEKNGSLGGQLRLTAALPARSEFFGLIRYHENALKDAGVKVELGREASADEILLSGFDEVVIATGRVHKPIKIRIKDNAPPVYTAEEVITENPVLGKRVAVIGGSFVGLEVARKLILEGSISPEQLFYLMRYKVEPPEKLEAMLNSSSRHVAVFEKGKLGAGYEPGIAWPVLEDLKRFGAELYKNTSVLEIDENGVVTADFTWPCDAVVVAVGMEPGDRLYEQLKGRIPCHIIGNAKYLGRAINAIEAGAELGCRL